MATGLEGAAVIATGAVVSIVTSEAVKVADNVTPVVKRLIAEPTTIDNYLNRMPGAQWLAPYREALLTRAGETAGSLSGIIVSSLTSTTGIPALATDAIAGITTQDIAALNTTQGHAFTQAQINVMSSDQLSALVDLLT